MIDTSHIDPHWPADVAAFAQEQPPLLDVGPSRPKGTARAIRRRLAEAPPVGEEFDLLRELRRRRQARTTTRKERP